MGLDGLSRPWNVAVRGLEPVPGDNGGRFGGGLDETGCDPGRRRHGNAPLRCCSAGSLATSGSGRATTSTRPRSLRTRQSTNATCRVSSCPRRSGSHRSRPWRQSEADLLVAAVPTSYLRTSLDGAGPRAAGGDARSERGQRESSTGRSPARARSSSRRWDPRPIAVLCGPSHAEELARGLPASVVVSGNRSG